jgi:hypothetical protein
MTHPKLHLDTEWISPGYMGRFYRPDLVLTLVRADDPDDLNEMFDKLTSDEARWPGRGPLVPGRAVGSASLDHPIAGIIPTGRARNG